MLAPQSGHWLAARFRHGPPGTGVIFVVSNREISRTEDGGRTWGPVADTAPGMPWYNDLAVDPLDPSRVYVTTTAGVYLVDGDGPSTAIGEERSRPAASELLPSYPNPFNATAIIPFRLGAPGRVQLRIYSVLGQQIRELVDGHMEAGSYVVRWDGREHHGHPTASGVYICALDVGGKRYTRRLLLLR